MHERRGLRMLAPMSLFSSHTAALAAILYASCDSLGGRGCAAPWQPEVAPVAAPSSAGAPAATTAAPAGSAAVAAAPARALGPGGVAAWDGLGAAEKGKLKTTPALYLHQSVGQDLEDGAEAMGFKFAYYGPGASSVESGLNGGLFNDVGPIDNGKPMEKLALVLKIAKLHRGTLKVIGFSFGYADVRDEDLSRVEAEYIRVAKEIRATGARMFHVTPPLVFDVAENAPKMKMRTWMLATFAGEPIFDLQDIESLDGGKRCEVGGVWRICQAHRSTSACPSKSQGIDGDGQGHLCSTKAAIFARGLLVAIARAGG